MRSSTSTDRIRASGSGRSRAAVGDGEQVLGVHEADRAVGAIEHQQPRDAVLDHQGLGRGHRGVLADGDDPVGGHGDRTERAAAHLEGAGEEVVGALARGSRPPASRRAGAASSSAVCTVARSSPGSTRSSTDAGVGQGVERA